ncbi:Glycosyltransferase involved in LPS biosynthesis, GR25 family [Albimonas donghaensis]|uniref:Glycosyltransferase involved in LPS biosynthesis, GR25 family n=1 Tax=Albimonas donghaensis TaxID=356660 RepID=A0A1H3FNP6_9RHOB|nr:glycosyltransferase family 25 protein [Albimonas donghaensis]SDX92703.1 Glycosyltransferase involved in LPS biosynthesis, GR25 family [Albimonas donghaensis]
MGDTYPIFVINLERHTARREFMRLQLDALGLSPIWIKGVDGKREADMKAAANAFYAPLSPGEVGCFESHRTVWKRIVEMDVPGAYVLEDDVVVSQDYGRLDLPAARLAGIDVLKLDYHPRDTLCGVAGVAIGEGKTMRRALGRENSTGSYFVSRAGAEKLLRLSEAFHWPVDLFMFNEVSVAFFALRTWKCIPGLATQTKFVTRGGSEDTEFADTIQDARRKAAAPPRRIGPFRRACLRLRLLLEWNFPAARRRRYAAFLKAFETSERTALTPSRWELTRRDHLAAAFAHMKLEHAEPVRIPNAPAS